MIEHTEWLINSLCALDLSKSSSELMVEVESLYTNKLQLTPKVDQGPKISLYGMSGFFIDESGFDGGLYKYLYRKYYLMDIRKATGIDFNTWMKQPYYIINRQISQIPELLEEKAKIMEKHNNLLSK